jgi:hypothetical protein
MRAAFTCALIVAPILIAAACGEDHTETPKCSNLELYSGRDLLKITTTANQPFSVSGRGILDGATVSFDCRDSNGNDVAEPIITSQSCSSDKNPDGSSKLTGGCSLTLDATNVPPGALCSFNVSGTSTRGAVGVIDPADKSAAESGFAQWTGPCVTSPGTASTVTQTPSADAAGD